MLAVKATLSTSHEEVLSVEWSLDGTQALSTGDNGLQLWDMSTLTAVHSLTEFEDDVNHALICNKDPNILYTACMNTIQKWDLRDPGHAARTFDDCGEEVNQLALNGSGQRLAAAVDSGDIELFNLTTMARTKSLKSKHKNICATVAFRPSKPKQLFSGGFDCQLLQWDFLRPKLLEKTNVLSLLEEIEGSEMLTMGAAFNPSFVHDLAVAPEDDMVACGLGSGAVVVADTTGLRPICELWLSGGHNQGVSQVSWACGSKYLLSGGNDSVVCLWEPRATGLPQACTTGEAHPSLACKREHGSKVNWLRCNGSLALVADQTQGITLLNVAPEQS